MVQIPETEQGYWLSWAITHDIIVNMSLRKPRQKHNQQWGVNQNKNMFQQHTSWQSRHQLVAQWAKKEHKAKIYSPRIKRPAVTFALGTSNKRSATLWKKWITLQMNIKLLSFCFNRCKNSAIFLYITFSLRCALCLTPGLLCANCAAAIDLQSHFKSTQVPLKGIEKKQHIKGLILLGRTSITQKN